MRVGLEVGVGEALATVAEGADSDSELVAEASDSEAVVDAEEPVLVGAATSAVVLPPSATNAAVGELEADDSEAESGEH